MLEDARQGLHCGDHDDVVAGRYRLGPALSRSAGCCAHRAHDELLQRTVRVTLVDSGPAEAAAFSLRPQGWQDRDPEVAELFDAGAEHDRLFLVTHHPDDPTLAETTPPGGLDLGQLRDLGTAVATALAPRHERGAAHGGLGAGTVAFTPQGASLAEFGLLPWLARWGDVPVTPPYVAPEQRAGVESGPATDVYALGRLLGELAPADGLRPELRTLLAEMTADSPGDRPSMDEVRHRLATGARGPLAAGARRRRALGLVAAACCLVGLAFGLVALTGEVPAAGSDGATLAVAAPVVPLAPGHGGTTAGGAASGHAATDVSTRSASAGRPPATGSEDAPRVVDAARRTSTATHDQDRADAATHTTGSPRSTTTRPTTDRDTGAGSGRDSGSTPTRSSQKDTGRPDDDAARPGHGLRGVLTQVGGSLGHRAQGGSEKDADHPVTGSTAEDAGDSPADRPDATRRPVLRTVPQAVDGSLVKNS